MSAAIAAPQRDHRGLLTIETGNALPVWNDFAKPPVAVLSNATEAAASLSGERALTQFAAVDFHARTPPWPRRLFRPGVQFHIHPQWCKTDAERTTCLEAIRMMGAKLTRGVAVASTTGFRRRRGSWTKRR